MDDLQEDRKLLSQVAKGDKIAFSTLLGRYKNKVFGTCFYLMGDKALAEDLSQETWIRVVKSAGDYQPIASVSSWILKIARNACLNELRTRKRWSELSPEEENQVVDEADIAESMLNKLQKQKQLQEAIVSLSPQQKVALMLVVQEDKSHAEVAKELNCSVGAVKVLLFRARESLKKRLEDT